LAYPAGLVAMGHQACWKKVGHKLVLGCWELQQEHMSVWLVEACSSGLVPLVAVGCKLALLVFGALAGKKAVWELA